eukprot:scaffold17751_cov227-Isochrysis_galbana.AAC.4
MMSNSQTFLTRAIRQEGARLDQGVDELEDGELVLILALDTDDEEERGVPSVYYLVPAILEEGALGLCPREALADHLRLQRASLTHGLPLVVLGQPCLPLLVHHKHEAERHATGPVRSSGARAKASQERAPPTTERAGGQPKIKPKIATIAQ